MLGLLVVGCALGYVLRTNLSIAGPALRTELGLTEVQLGLVLSAFATAYALFQIPGGILGERIGARRTLTWLFVGWGVVTILIGLVPGRAHAPLWLILGSLIVLRGLLGALQAPFFPVSVGGTVAAWLPPTQWGLANGLQNVGNTLGAAMSAPIIVWLIVQFGWRRAIVAAGPLALGLAACWWWYNRDDPREHRRVNEQELVVIASGRAGPVAPTGLRWTTVFTNRHLLLLTLSYFGINYLFYLFFNWFYYYMTEVRHVSPETAGYFTSVQWMLGAVAAAAGGVVCDRLSARLGSDRGCRWTVMGGILLATPCLLFGAVAANAVAMVVLLSMSFASTQLVDAAYWVAAMRIAGPQASIATGILNTGGNLSGGVAAILVPLLADSLGWVAAVASGAVFAIAAASLWLWIRADGQA
jgi:ACS family glucarate transporter-like MFS transporter